MYVCTCDCGTWVANQFLVVRPLCLCVCDLMLSQGRLPTLRMRNSRNSYAPCATPSSKLFSTFPTTINWDEKYDIVMSWLEQASSLLVCKCCQNQNKMVLNTLWPCFLSNIFFLANVQKVPPTGCVYLNAFCLLASCFPDVPPPWPSATTRTAFSSENDSRSLIWKNLQKLCRSVYFCIRSLNMTQLMQLFKNVGSHNYRWIYVYK